MTGREISVAVVDDDPADLHLIRSYVERYCSEHERKVRVSAYADGLDFLDDMKKNFDIVFMDIEMPHLDGLKTAKRMRQTDESTVLVFITNMAQYAIHGYEVNAIEFMVKPVGYYNFSDKMEKALKYLKQNTETFVLLKSEETIFKMPVSKIYYLEKDRNYVIYHTAEGVYRERGSMAEMEEKLKGEGFSKCISGCLVNLRYVSKMAKDVVWVNGESLPVSRTQKKTFVQDFADYLGGGMV